MTTLADALWLSSANTQAAENIIAKPASAALNQPVKLNPVNPTERLHTLDILRGFAIFGVLMVNMPLFSAPAEALVSPALGTIDRIAGRLNVLLAAGAFNPLFTFLFGLGFAIQLSRAESRGANFIPVYTRRLIVLMIIGLAHAIFLWWADVLFIYALLGFPLLLFRRCSQKNILIVALVCLLVFLFAEVGVQYFRTQNSPSAQTASRVTEERQERNRNYNQELSRIYSTGSFTEIMAQRLDDIRRRWLTTLLHIPLFFSMFLLGLFVGRRAIVQGIDSYLPFIRRVMWTTIGIWFAGNLLSYLMGKYLSLAEYPLVKHLSFALRIISTLAISFFYASAIILLCRREFWLKALMPLAAVGRTALSNYLLQSLLCTTIFYGYGFGLYGQIGPAAAIALTILMFSIQILLSVMWLRRFRFGPMESLWRALTYGKSHFN